jgi:hypothetical protein
LAAESAAVLGLGGEAMVMVGSTTWVVIAALPLLPLPPLDAFCEDVLLLPPQSLKSPSPRSFSFSSSLSSSKL